jgi:hypothetical protein
MELKEGMYVRTKGGFIDKIISFKSTISNDYVELEDEYYANKKDILKASNNIIDLIEVGDYVNGYEVTSKDQFLGIGNHDWYIADYEIKSIVTKEQFESMSYRV